MNKNIDNKIDKLLKKAIRDVTPDSPGEGFVLTVMQKVKQTRIQPTKQPEPLISWKGWLLIGIISGIMFSLVFFTDSYGNRFDQIHKYYDDFILSYFSIFISRLFVLGMVLLAILFLFQIWLVTWRFGRMKNSGH